MKTRDWLYDIIKDGLLCEQYTDKVNNAQSKVDFMNLVLDSNGVTFIQEMSKHGKDLPYDIMTEEFEHYINGRYVARYMTNDGTEYTSCVYCRYDYDVDIKSTLTTFFGCDTNVIIPEHSSCMIFLDKRCNIRLHCPKSSNVKIECWGDSVLEIVGEKHKGIKIKRR